MSRRRVTATLMRKTGPGVDHTRVPVWTRHYAYFDTAMPRAVQLALSQGVEGDIVEFTSSELGFQMGVLRVKAGGKFDVEMSPLVKASPTLLKLMEKRL